MKTVRGESAPVSVDISLIKYVTRNHSLSMSLPQVASALNIVHFHWENGRSHTCARCSSQIISGDDMPFQNGCIAPETSKRNDLSRICHVMPEHDSVPGNAQYRLSVRRKGQEMPASGMEMRPSGPATVLTVSHGTGYRGRFLELSGNVPDPQLRTNVQ